MFFLASNGYRVIAHDRRGHGRSSQTWEGNDMNTYADDLAALLEELDVTAVTLVGFSAGGGEVARYVGRHGTRRVAKVALVASVPPLMLLTDENPKGVPLMIFDQMRAAATENRSQLYKTIASGPFFGFNRPGAVVNEGLVDWFWAQGMMAGNKCVYDCIAAFSATDFTADLAKLDVPVLVIHGSDDQIVPIETAGMATAKLVPHAKLKVYEGAPHGLTDTHKQRLNDDLLLFLREG